MQKSRQSKDHDDIFDKLKEAVVNERRKASPLRIIVGGVGGNAGRRWAVENAASDATARFTKPPSGS